MSEWTLSDRWVLKSSFCRLQVAGPRSPGGSSCALLGCLSRKPPEHPSKDRCDRRRRGRWRRRPARSWVVHEPRRARVASPTLHTHGDAHRDRRERNGDATKSGWRNRQSRPATASPRLVHEVSSAEPDGSTPAVFSPFSSLAQLRPATLRTLRRGECFVRAYNDGGIDPGPRRATMFTCCAGTSTGPCLVEDA